jgi:cyclic beta-1,2-glucan synthetase
MALQQQVRLVPFGSAEVVLLLGAAEDIVEARALISKYRKAGAAETALEAVKDNWRSLLGYVDVRTPDPAFNIVMNGWLVYQTLSCRMWARSGFYQASGAYGFRDQLQDSMTVAHVRPDISRHHILTAASRQFVEGDVQHWWLPATGAGVRTKISDDTVWLAYCTAYYVEVTGDAAILDEACGFLQGRPVAETEHDAFYVPETAPRSAPLYEHCAIGLERNLPAGAHGLPFMGTGDWNDGMNQVGEHGTGESVWLGWFLHATLAKFVKIAEARGDKDRADRWGKRMKSLAASLDANAWDGEWYRRAYFDDGTPLGSAQNQECRIDTIAQSWAVLSGAADPDKARTALESADRHLVDEKNAMALLFTPPFRNSVPSPGYIQSYPAGVRENGGQYSHGALWAIFAHARLGQTEKTFRLFSLINPVNHALNEADALRYRVEPYVIAADVYSAPRHLGRGGWTWYTGAAGWAFRAGLEAVLGLYRQGDSLIVKPCVPAVWTRYEVTYRSKGVAHRFIFVQDEVAEAPDGYKTLEIAEGASLNITLDDASAGAERNYFVRIR